MIPEWIRSIISAPSFWGVFIPACVAIVVFFLTERNKLRWEQYKRKEERYQNLLTYLRGFYVSGVSKEDKEQFLAELNQCWLYAPDDIIKKAYVFLESVHTGAATTNEEKERLLGDLVVAIRKDLMSRMIVKSTRLRGKDFKNLRAT